MTRWTADAHEARACQMWMGFLSERKLPIAKDRASILVIEDDAALRELWRSTLDEWGYDVTAVKDAPRAMPHVVRAPYVAVCDVHLPGASGLWFADQIRSVSPFTAIVLAADGGIRPVENLRAGIVAYLVKPIEPEELKSAVEAGVRWSAMRRTQ